MWEHALRFTVGSQSPRGSYLVPLCKARGGPQVCLLFAFRNQPIAAPRAASELHWRDGPHFKGIARPNILRTGIQRLDHFLTASSAARGRRSEPPRYGEQRSARASEWTPAPRRAAQREGVELKSSATASGAARTRLPTGCWGLRWGGRRLAGWGPLSGVGGGGARHHEGVRPNVSACRTVRRRPSQLQRYGEQRSARASARTTALRRAAQRERAFPAAAGWWGRGAASWRGGRARRGGARGGRPTTFARWPRY